MKLPTTKRNLSNAEVLIIGPEMLLQHADEARALLSQAEDIISEFMSIEDVLLRVAAGKYQLWMAREEKIPFLCMVTEIITYPNKRVLKIVFLAGIEFRGFWNNMPVLEHWASKLGCSEITMQTRPAIAKLLEDQGYKVEALVVGKKLDAQRKGH